MRQNESPQELLTDIYPSRLHRSLHFNWDFNWEFMSCLWCLDLVKGWLGPFSPALQLIYTDPKYNYFWCILIIYWVNQFTSVNLYSGEPTCVSRAFAFFFITSCMSGIAPICLWSWYTWYHNHFCTNDPFHNPKLFTDPTVNLSLTLIKNKNKIK